MIRLEQATVAPGGTILLEGADWHVRVGMRTALVGRNGTGKTSVLRVLAGLDDPAAGRVVLRPGLRLGWLPQQAVSGSERTVWDEARSALVGLADLRRRLDVATEALHGDDPAAPDRHAVALEAFGNAGGFAEDERVGTVLHGLGFGPETWARGCNTLSGGWQMRVALAKVLLSDPDVALLDEPTNHLDAAARTWLAGALAGWGRAVVVVSHDRHLLDAVATDVVEVRAGRLHHYAMGYSAALVERESRKLLSARTAEATGKEIARLQGFVDRFGAKATKAAAAHAMEKRIVRLGPVQTVEAETAGPRLILPPAPACDITALTLKSASVGWADGPPVLVGVDLVLERGMRLALLGPNGTGKSTLLQSLAGRLPLKAGRRWVGDRVRIGVFDQDLAASLPADATALEHLGSKATREPTVRLRAALGALGLSGEAALRPIATLSGGEKARVALAALVASPANVLLLDEPTNHLDVVAIESLCVGLAQWEGTLVLVSHDRWLVERLATHVGTLVHGVVDVRPGVRAADFEPPPRVAAAPRAGPSEWDGQRHQQRERGRAARRAERLEVEIEVLETALGALDGRLFDVAADWSAAAVLGRERDQLVTKLAERMTAWEVAVAESEA